jgi:hypothetical protein
MSGRSFKSVFMVASCAGAALGCYLVSLRVATERAALEDVETKIVLAQRDLRLLQTEIGTRGRLAQLERWNAKVLALSAPSADQFLEGGFELAKMTAPVHQAPVEAPVVLASAPAPERGAQPVMDSDADAPAQRAQAKSGPAAMLHVASLKRTVEVPSKAASQVAPVSAKPVLKLPADKPVAKAESKPKAPTKAVAKTEPRPAAKTPANRPATVPEKKSASAPKPAAKKLAMADPLAPLPVKVAARKPAFAPAKTSPKTTKDPARKQ